MIEKQLVYLACPYSHPDKAMEIHRFECANRAAAKLMSEGEMVYSPISHSHPIALAGTLPLDWNYWKTLARVYLEASKKVVVLRLSGWTDSVGVNAEIEIARGLGIPIEYMDPI